MAFDAKKTAAEVVQLVGGTENISSVAHCMTRLRFVVKDLNKADQEALKKIPGVLGVIYAGGQLMVVLGKNLLPVYEAVVKDFDLKEGAAINENLDVPKEKQPLTVKSAGVAVLNYVSAAVSPMITGLVAGGMLKGAAAAHHAGECRLCRYRYIRPAQRRCGCSLLLHAHLCCLRRSQKAGRHPHLLHDLCRSPAARQVHRAGGCR